MFRQHVLPWTLRGVSCGVLYYRYQGGLLEASGTKGGCGQEKRRWSRPEEPHKLTNRRHGACTFFLFFTHSFTQKLTSHALLCARHCFSLGEQSGEPVWFLRLRGANHQQITQARIASAGKDQRVMRVWGRQRAEQGLVRTEP